MIFFIILMILWGSFCFYMLYRNNQVHDYRIDIINKIYMITEEDPTLPWRWRYEEYQSISYEKMLWTFWKPLDSFYKNTDFYTK